MKKQRIPATIRPATRSLILALAVLMGFVVLSAAPGRQGFGVPPSPPQPPDSRVRKAEREPGKRLVDMLRPEDDVVEVEEWRPSGTPVPPPPGVSAAQVLARQVQAVAIVEVESVAGELSSDGQWVNSKVKAIVVDPLKSGSSLPLSPGQSIEFVSPNGEVNVGRQTLRARFKGSQFFQVGSRYLVYVRQPNGLFVSVSEAALVKDDEVEPMSVDAREIFTSRSKDVVIADVLSVARQPK